MKELSIEQKAEAYDKGLQKSKEFYTLCKKCGAKDTVDFLESLFPELRESEDERIREELIQFIKNWKDPNNIGRPHDFPTLTRNVEQCDRYIAWLEKQDIFSKKDIDDAYLKGVTDTKNEIEKQYEANYQIRKDIATFIFNYKGDIKDRAKWMNYLGIKVSFVDEQGEKRHKFTIGDIIISDNNTLYRVNNIVKNCIGQDCYFLVNIERENKGMRYLRLTNPRGETYNFGEITWLCEQVDAKFEKAR